MDLNIIPSLVMVCFVCALPFTFVVLMVWIKARSRDRQLAQIMEERRLMIERGIAPPELKLPAEEDRPQRDPLANLKAGVVMIFTALGLAGALVLWPAVGPAALHALGLPVAAVLGAIGLGFIVVHLLARTTTPQDDTHPTLDGSAGEDQ
jgi:hypothetical protein